MANPSRKSRNPHSTPRLTLEPLECRQLLSTIPFAGLTHWTRDYHMPQWDPNGSTYLGLTQLKTVGNAEFPQVNKGVVHLTFDLYNPTSAPGSPSYWGSELISNRAYSVAEGTTLTIKWTARLDASTPPGIVLGMFPYLTLPGDTHHEFDFEATSVELNSGNRILTNFYINDPLGAGSPAAFNLPLGGSLADWHTYELRLDKGVVVNGITPSPGLSTAR